MMLSMGGCFSRDSSFLWGAGRQELSSGLTCRAEPAMWFTYLAACVACSWSSTFGLLTPTTISSRDQCCKHTTETVGHTHTHSSRALQLFPFC